MGRHRPQSVASSFPSALSNVPGLSKGKAFLHEGRRKDLRSSQSSLKAPRETANENQLINLHTRLKYRGPKVARLDPEQESQKAILYCVK